MQKRRLKLTRFKSFEEFKKSIRINTKVSVKGSYKAFILPNKQILTNFIKRNNFTTRACRSTVIN